MLVWCAWSGSRLGHTECLPNDVRTLRINTPLGFPKQFTWLNWCVYLLWAVSYEDCERSKATVGRESLARTGVDAIISSRRGQAGDTFLKVNGEGQQSTSCIMWTNDRRPWQEEACFALANKAVDLLELVDRKAKHTNRRNVCRTFVSRQH